MSGEAYDATPSVITWSEVFGNIKLDRVTLLLSFSPLESGEATKNAQCEAYTSMADFREVWKARMIQKQKEIDEQMKDNKI
jgi:hypothetical protein